MDRVWVNTWRRCFWLRPLPEPERPVTVRGVIPPIKSSPNPDWFGAIVRAVKTSEPEARGLPVIQGAAGAGCC